MSETTKKRSAKKRPQAKPARTPRTARTFNQICELPRDNLSYAAGWFSISDTTVTIAEQRAGEGVTAMITLPRRVFDRIVDWYNTGSTKPEAR